MHKHENSTPSALNSHQRAQERPVNFCSWELALVKILWEEVEGIRCLSTSVLMKKKCGRATSSSGSKARDVVTLGYTCCYFLCIHELLCHSFKSVLCCLKLNAVQGIFKVVFIHPFYSFFYNGLLFLLFFF